MIPECKALGTPSTPGRIRLPFTMSPLSRQSGKGRRPFRLAAKSGPEAVPGPPPDGSFRRAPTAPEPAPRPGPCSK